VNFAHRGSQRWVENSQWYNMISTGGASLQIALVYKSGMKNELKAFFNAVRHASLVCNVERIPFDWIDVFAGVEDHEKTDFVSVFEDVKAQARLLERQLKFHMNTKREIQKLFALGFVGDDGGSIKYFNTILKINDAEIDDILGKLNTIYDPFEETVTKRCVGANCFVGISFLGVMNAEGECYEEQKQIQGYHVIAGVDKFKILFEIANSPPYAAVVPFDARVKLLDAREEDVVSSLIAMDVLFETLVALVAKTLKPASQPNYLPNNEFLPAGNWKLGLDLYDVRHEKKLLAVYVKKNDRITQHSNGSECCWCKKNRLDFWCRLALRFLPHMQFGCRCWSSRCPPGSVWLGRTFNRES